MAITEKIRFEAEAEVTKITEIFADMQNAPLVWQSKDEASFFVQSCEAILFDADGCLYRTPDPIPGATDCIRELMASGRKVLFVTNNAEVSRKMFQEKLSSILGLEGLTEEQMISSSFAAAEYLKNAFNKSGNTRRRVHVVGGSGLCQEMKDAGFDVSGGPSEDRAGMTRQELADYEFPEDPVDAVVVGHDVEFSFRKLSVANNLLLRNSDCLFVATNKDAYDLVGADGLHIPGNGALVAALEYCSGRRASNVGKPSPELLDIIVKDHSFDPSKAMFVGDRLDTDIKFAVDTGMFATLVLTGVTTASTLSALTRTDRDKGLFPCAIISHVGRLV